jgi:hypothetical protein
MRPDYYRTIRRTFACLLAAVGLITPSFSDAQAAAAPPKFIPAINVPTIKLSDIQTAGGSMDVPWIANYVGGIYEYAVGAAVVLAGVMLVVGGFRYQTAGGDASKVSAAKTRIIDAIVGLTLTLGAYVILNTINTNLVGFSAITVKSVKGAEGAMILAAGEKGGGFAPPEAYTQPSATAPPALQPTGGPSGSTPPSPTGAIQTDKADDPSAGAPPVAFPQLFNGEIPDLYKPNEYGTVVPSGPNTTWSQRMNSVCVWKLKNKGPSDPESVLKRAAAITRVWITEAVYNNGAIYSRGGNADFWFLRAAYNGSGGVASCMQKRIFVSDLAECDINKKKCPSSDFSSVHKSMQSAYASCKIGELAKKGYSLGHCTDWVLSLARCALLENPTKTFNSAEKDATIKIPTGDPIVEKIPPPWMTKAQQAQTKQLIERKRINPTYWLNAIKSAGGPKPFDLYHLGRAAYSPLCHTVMYIGGMNIKAANGQPIYWIEMGGGGAADLGGSRNLASGVTACPRVEGSGGGCETGVSLHFNPNMDTHNSLAGCYFNRLKKDAQGKVIGDDGQIMIRLLDQVGVQ